MHMYAKCDKNIPCGSIVMNIFTDWLPRLRTDGRTNILIILQTQEFCNKMTLVLSCQLRVTVTSCFVYKVIRDL